MVKCLPTIQKTWVRFLGREDPLEQKMASHSSIHAWKIPWTEEPGGLQPIGSQSQTRLSNFTSLLHFTCHYLQFSSVAQSCPTLCDPMDCSMPGLPVHHQLLKFTQTHVIGDAIQPSHPLWSPSPPALNLSQHQGLFK